MTTNDTTTAPASTIKDPLEADFTYLQGKAPSDLHELHAALISELSGVEISAKQVQAVLAMHGKIQASEANRKRAGYKGRTAESIRKGGQTTVEHMDQRLNTPVPAAVAAKPKPAPRKPRTPKTAAPVAEVQAEAVAS